MWPLLEVLEGTLDMEHEIGGRGQGGLPDLSLGPLGLCFHSLDRKKLTTVVWTEDSKV